MGIRVIKTAIAALAAIYAAQLLELQNPLSAGILAILAVEVTRKKGIQSATVRFIASVVGLLSASFIFVVFGFRIWALSLFILISFPILSKWNLKDGIITSAVVVFHIFAGETVSLDAIMNEVILLIVGLGCATVINLLYMPKEEHKLVEQKKRLEVNFSAIFRHIAEHLKDSGYVWSGEELLEAHAAVEEGSRLAMQSSENRLISGDVQWLTYFQMRKRQLEFISRMLDRVAQVYETLPHGVLTSELFELLSIEVKTEYYTGEVEEALNGAEIAFKAMALPATRAEFEVRSALLQLTVDLRHYLMIAKHTKKRRPLSEKAPV